MPGRDDRSDDDLIDACNAGDAAAFGELYRRYRDWAVRVAYRFAGDRDEALDIMQESFAYLLSKFPGFRLSARLTSFMYVVIKHNALAARRKQRRRPPAISSGAEESPAGPAATPDAPPAAEAAAALSRLVDRLPDSHREVLLMRAVDGMSMQEIAAALSIPVGTAKSRLHHALATLRADPAGARYFGPETGV
jgi:RNA polymerase sigma-70 factor (ECF subfamily)